MWLYGSGFPKSMNVGKAIDKRRDDTDDLQTEVANQWEGWGTALKPAWEPIVLARKPFKGTVAKNVVAHGTGALNIDACRIGNQTRTNSSAPGKARSTMVKGMVGGTETVVHDHGRWPANLILDPEAGALLDAQTGVLGTADKRGASRFFYCAKTSKKERGEGNDHPTVKPRALMRWLCRLVTPLGGVVLDPFMGSGSTLLAANAEGFKTIGIDTEERYCEIAASRLRGNAPGGGS
jgi:site-specific DNA-methyltransferase (adenine-specific)